MVILLLLVKSVGKCHITAECPNTIKIIEALIVYDIGSLSPKMQHLIIASSEQGCRNRLDGFRSDICCDWLAFDDKFNRFHTVVSVTDTQVAQKSKPLSRIITKSY